MLLGPHQVLGGDLAGHVEEVGEGSKFKKGDAVAALTPGFWVDTQDGEVGQPHEIMGIIQWRSFMEMIHGDHLYKQPAACLVPGKGHALGDTWSLSSASSH